MKRLLLGPLAVIALCFVFTPMTSLPASAEEMGDIVRGGKLYDKWYKVVRAKKPKTTHSAWPASNTKKKGAATHRCKACHGWDTQGKDGAYASGSYKTGIKGLKAQKGADPAAIVAILKDKTHGYGEYLDDSDLKQIAVFVAKGQVDMDNFIDRKTKAVKGGDAAKGASYFNTICAQCHGAKGTLPKDMKKTLAEQLSNPWEVAHKILNGQPGERMPALHALDLQITKDIMAHLETLPKSR